MAVPYFRPDLSEAEIAAVVEVLRSGWLTTGPRTTEFEKRFAEAVRAPHAVACSSGTAALHLAVVALGLRPGQAVLLPTLTFAATAEAVLYAGAIPILVDVDPGTLQFDPADAARKIAAVRSGALRSLVAPDVAIVGVIPVHVGGALADLTRISELADAHGLWVVEDAAHAFPSAWRSAPDAPWIACGEGTSDVTCFSFYANKTLTTGEGGMAVTAHAALADRMRMLSLHGLSQDGWSRYTGGATWDYQILEPGFKYNLTDVAAALGLGQLARAPALQAARETVAARYAEGLAGVEEIELPVAPPDQRPSWHLYAIRLRLERLGVDRDAFVRELREAGIGCSVHWRPLHLHHYYKHSLGWPEDELPAASREWRRLVSLPMFPSLTAGEQDEVIGVVRALCRRHARAGGQAVAPAGAGASSHGPAAHSTGAGRP